MKKTLRKGFTLVELIVVIAIIAILAAVSVAGYFGFISLAKQSRANSEAKQVKTAVTGLCAGQGFATKTIASETDLTITTLTLENGGLKSSDTTLDATTAAHVIANIYTWAQSENPTEYALGFVQTANKACVFSATVASGVITAITYQTAENITASIDFTK